MFIQPSHIDKYLTNKGKELDGLSRKYDKCIWMGGFNAELAFAHLTAGLIKKPTFFKNPDNPTCIDLILTSR